MLLSYKPESRSETVACMFAQGSQSPRARVCGGRGAGEWTPAPVPHAIHSAHAALFQRSQPRASPSSLYSVTLLLQTSIMSRVLPHWIAEKPLLRHKRSRNQSARRAVLVFKSATPQACTRKQGCGKGCAAAPHTGIMQSAEQTA